MKPTSTLCIIMASLLVLTACGSGAAETPAPAQAATPRLTTPTPDLFTVAEVTDLGGIDDRSFNALAWEGAQQAAAAFGVQPTYVESDSEADYPRNIQMFLDNSIDLMITIGYLLVVDTALAAKAYPGTKFAIVDNTYPDCFPGAVEGTTCGSFTELPNVRGLIFQTDEAAFLAGYAAAGMTRTGRVATFGGIKIPTVTIFMKGFEAGVRKYNETHLTAVQVLGWNTASDTGVFVDNFEAIEDGRAAAEDFIEAGADIIMPVAGPVGQGSAAVCQETGRCWIIGVDSDWYESNPEFKELILTSVIKKIDVAVYDTIKDAVEGNFTAGTVVYRLSDGGVDLAPFHDFEGQVPADLKAELDQLKRDIISGAVRVGG